MSNQSYLSVWCKDYPEENIPARLAAFLATVPLSEEQPGFTQLVIRAVDAAETPLLEQDLRAAPLDAVDVAGIVQEHLHSDCSYEIRCFWDLAVFDETVGKAKIQAQPLEISCRGEGYDAELWRQEGHFEVSFGFEHLFTGHANVLGISQGTRTAPQSVEEARFLEALAWPENFETYQEATRTNIRKLLDWVRRIENALPVNRLRLWSEGEENFEARLEYILAAR